MLTRAEMTAYIRRRLGGSTVRIEISDQDIDDAITDALQMYRNWSSDGTYPSLYALNINSTLQSYTLPAGIREVIHIVTGSFSRVLTTNIIDPYLNIFGPNNQGYAIVEIGSEYLSDIQRMFGTIWEFETHIDPTSGNLVLDILSPQTAVANVDWVGLQVIKDIDETVLMDTQWVKAYTLSLSKMRLGEAREKYTQLAGPNGPQLNGAALKSEAQTEIDKLYENLLSQHYRPVPIIQG